MNVAFIKHPQQYVDYQQGGNDQYYLACLGRLERRRIPGIAGQNARGHIQVALELLDPGGGVPKRGAGSKIEGDRQCFKLARMVNCNRTHLAFDRRNAG